MADAHSPDTLVLDASDSATTFQKQLARRGIGGYDTVRLPWSTRTLTDRDELTPTDVRAPISSDAIRKLNAVVDAPETTTVYLHGPTPPSELVTTFAAQRAMPLVTISAGFTHAEDLYGSMTIIDNHAEWLAGTFARVLQMTTDGEVLLHIEDAAGMDETALRAMLALLSRETTVEFDVNGETVVADLSNLTAVFTDVDEPRAVEETLDAAMYRRGFDVTLFSSAHDRYQVAAEAAMLSEAVGLSETEANTFAEAASTLREMADDPEGPLTIAPAHGKVREWATLAKEYHNHDFRTPAVDAGENVILRTLYSDDHDAYKHADATIRDYVTGVFTREE